ncbi:asparagine synthase-related protein [Allocoleopsis franciscana]|uniref:asparagine synthase (glutamine-hydrolyzing) n=1 Tax=Allocoleopsis franciscana PCC 7113 TaxID=1173027 RepID=K9WLQ4_9CYAN|nr:asparagine synthetase B family protein [Allocoleopsis franciscana]AFZ20709.1 asparagine synthase (glutamine-hydrolyzing) [Allocoleopsis franciscana PCC 7113]
MANFILIIDPDLERRSHFAQTIEPLLPPVTGLITNSCTTGDFYAGWAASPHAPISWDTDHNGATIIWGDAIKSVEATRIDSRELRTLWNDSLNTSVPCFDGFYAAVAYRPDFGLTVGADLLGLFPVYYYTYRDIILVGSSPELFQHHPLFKKAFNPAGLVGILLTNGLIDGQTLWQNVRRLNAGHSLIWQPSVAPTEVKQYQILSSAPDDSYKNLSFSEHLNIVEQVLDQALRSQIPTGERCSLMLSGGLDSRMIAGFLHRQGVETVALTLGKPSDIEMQCAIPVARTLGLKHYKIEISRDRYPLYADPFIKWEHLANGGNGLMRWGIHPHLTKLAPRVVSGYLIDRIIGGKWTYSLPTQALSFDTYFSQINLWGFAPQLLETLLHKDVFGDLVQDTLEVIRKIYNSYSDLDFKRTLCFELYHRQRFHIGSIPWQLCFGAWPVLPFLSKQLLETTAAIPVESLMQRRMQKELVCQRFGQLAALPLDRNDYNTEPLKPRQRRPSIARLYRLQQRLQQRWRRLEQKLGYERRYYYRIYDINHPGWQAVRQQAEPYRPLVRHLFDEQVFDSLLPPPDVPVQFRYDAITEASGIKALLGFLLWSKEHL